MTLTDQLPDDAEPGRRLRRLRDWAAEQGFALYPHQEEALIEIVSGANVILVHARPARARAWSRPARTSPRWPGTTRTFYTAPIKALVSEKFFALCDIFGPARSA